MTRFELVYLGLEPFFPPLYGQVRSRIASVLADHRTGRIEMLDVGGRKSHYTIGMRARISISDLPRKSELQQSLHLGITGEIVAQTLGRRSNVQRIVFDDMTRSSWKSSTFDCVVAVEVLEHVERDREFVAEVYRVLKPGGVFIMTTPNGDAVVNTNPDHKRHYRRQELADLLNLQFPDVDVRYAIRDSQFRRWGLESWSAARPLQTARTMLSNVISRIQSAPAAVNTRASGTRHLIASARKQL